MRRVQIWDGDPKRGRGWPIGLSGRGGEESTVSRGRRSRKPRSDYVTSTSPSIPFSSSVSRMEGAMVYSIELGMTFATIQAITP